MLVDHVRLGHAKGPRVSVDHATITYAHDSASQLELSILDPEWELWCSGQIVKHRVVVTPDSQQWTVRGRHFHGEASTLIVDLTVQPRSVVPLRDDVKAGHYHVDLSKWFEQKAHAAGLRTVIEPFGVRKFAQHSAKFASGGSDESVWDVGVRLAESMGAWFFEARGVLFFGRPTWLARRKGGRTWRVKCAPPAAGKPGYPLWLAAPPEFEDSLDEDDPTQKATWTLQLIGEDRGRIRPGDRVETTGIVNGAWIVTEVTDPCDGHSPVTATAGKIVNPKADKS